MNDGLKNWYFPIFCAFVIMFAAFESAIWKNLFEYLPSPVMWLSVIVYTSIVAPPIETLIMIYVTSFFLQTMTVMPVGYLIFIQTVIFIMIRALRTRIYWEGRTYFLFLQTLAILLLHVIHIGLSTAFEENPIYRFQIWSWVGEVCTFIVLSPVVFWMLTSILPMKDSHLDDESMVVNG